MPDPRQKAGVRGLFEPLWDSLPLGVMAIRKDRRVLWWNSRLEQWTDRRREEVLGLPMQDVERGVLPAGMSDRLNEVFLHGNVIHSAGPNLIGSRAPQRVQETTITPLRLDSEVIAVVYVAIEDSDSYSSEQENGPSITKSLTNASTKGMARALKGAGTALSDLLEGVRDLGLMQTEYLDLVSQPFGLAQWIEESVLFLEDAFPQSIDNVIVLDTVRDVDCLGTDPVRLRQLLMNLTSAALACTEGAPTTLEIDLDDGEGGSVLRFRLRIPSGAGETREGAAHLGIDIAQALTRILKGSLSRSVEGHTETLAVTVPVTIRERQPFPAHSWEGWTGFLIESDPRRALAMEGWLTELGFRVSVMEHGSQAWERIPILQAPIGVFLVSSSTLDDEDFSLEDLRALQEETGLRAIVFGDECDGEELEDAEPERQWTRRPRTRGGLQRILSRLKTDEQDVGEASEESVAARVLVVEDNAVNRRLAADLLRRFGYEVSVVSGGEEALECLKAQAFDVVLMDCHMPGLDGFETTRRIRHHESAQSSSSRLPVIAMTSAFMEPDVKLGREVGMDAFIAKPATKGELRSALDAWVGSPEIKTPSLWADPV